MDNSNPTLHFFCGKMASGKSSLARELSQAEDAILICEDLWLSKLIGEQIHSFEDYLKYAERLKAVLFPHVKSLLRSGLSVVMDFPANTVRQRQWFKDLYSAAGAKHCLHFVEASDALCLRQLDKRNREKPEGSKVMSEAEFTAITAYFQPPSSEEGFTTRSYRKG